MVLFRVPTGLSYLQANWEVLLFEQNFYITEAILVESTFRYGIILKCVHCFYLAVLVLILYYFYALFVLHKVCLFAGSDRGSIAVY